MNSWKPRKTISSVLLLFSLGCTSLNDANPSAGRSGSFNGVQLTLDCQLTLRSKENSKTCHLDGEIRVSGPALLPRIGVHSFSLKPSTNAWPVPLPVTFVMRNGRWQYAANAYGSPYIDAELTRDQETLILKFSDIAYGVGKDGKLDDYATFDVTVIVGDGEGTKLKLRARDIPTRHSK